jgi:hypothetical protein
MAASDPAGAREEARRILDDDRFQDADLPRPLEGPLDRLGDLVEWIGDALGDLLSGAGLPGGRPVGYAILAGAIVLVAVAIASRTIDRRQRTHDRAARDAAAAAGRLDARALVREAERAEREGDLARAVRLRFRAGVARLGERGVVEPRPSLTTYEVARALRSPDFDALARAFDEIAYGGRPAGADDLAAARERWPRVLEGAPR